MAKTNTTKSYRPNAFVPNTSFTGTEPPFILDGENMLIRYSQSGSVYAEGYSGSKDLSEAVPTKTLTGTISWTADSKTITGVGTEFISELHLGSFVLGDGGAGLTQLFVVERIDSDTSFLCSRAPSVSSSSKSAYVLPVIFPIGIDRGTAVRGNVVQFFKGHYLGVGDGTFRKNGAAINTTFPLSSTPQFALYDPATNTYSIDDVGIDKPTLPFTISAFTIDTAITAAPPANPTVITVAGAHGIYTGQQITISGATGNTGINGSWTITKLTSSTFSIPVDTSAGAAYAGSGVIAGVHAQMRAGLYNIRVCAKNTETKGFSQPTDVIAPVTLTAGQAIKIVFNSAMHADQNAYDIYSSEFTDNSSGTVLAAYQGPWYLVRTATADMMIDSTYTTGRAAGASFVFGFSDYEINQSKNILTFDNFPAEEAEFVDLINGIPIYFSCLGKGNTAKLQGTSPGPVAIASKPTNLEAVVLNKAVTMVGGDYIIGEFNAKSRVFTLGQNSLQQLILTTIDEEPIAFRSLWNCGFRNPYNVCFAKEYLYGFSTQKIVRSVAGGDDSSMEFEFTSDINSYIANWECGHVLAGNCPKNRAVIFFYSAFERRFGYWVTVALPFMMDFQRWNPPIILKKTNSDFIVSGVATIGDQLTFLAGGRTSTGSIEVGTYVFDGGSTAESYDWFLGWNYSDDGIDLNCKTVKGAAITGRFDGATTVEIYGARLEDDIDYLFANAADNTITFTDPASANIKRRRFKFADTGPFSLYAAKASGTYTPTGTNFVTDRLDEVVIKVEVNNSDA